MESNYISACCLYLPTMVGEIVKDTPHFRPVPLDVGNLSHIALFNGIELNDVVTYVVALMLDHIFLSSAMPLMS